MRSDRLTSDAIVPIRRRRIRVIKVDDELLFQSSCIHLWLKRPRVAQILHNFVVVHKFSACGSRA